MKMKFNVYTILFIAFIFLCCQHSNIVLAQDIDDDDSDELFFDLDTDDVDDADDDDDLFLIDDDEEEADLFGGETIEPSTEPETESTETSEGSEVEASSSEESSSSSTESTIDEVLASAEEVGEEVVAEMTEKELKKNKKTFLKSFKKEFKTEYKSYKKLTPQEIVAVQEDLEYEKNREENLQAEVDECKKEKGANKSELTKLKSQLISAQSQIDELRKEIEELKANPPIAATGTIASEAGTDGAVETGQTSQPASSTAVKGIVFKVQLGAYQQFDLNQSAIAGVSIEVENLGGWKKYTAGAYTTYPEADILKRRVHDAGMSDAFIVAYKDGVRIDMQSAIGATRIR